MSENQKLREALQLIAWSNDSKWQADCARQALAMPTEPSQTLYECVGCNHLYQHVPSSCDCCNNPENMYNTWTATKD